jgi:hypothetical protein
MVGVSTAIAAVVLDIIIPVCYNDGTPIPHKKLIKTLDELIERYWQQERRLDYRRKLGRGGGGKKDLL